MEADVVHKMKCGGCEKNYVGQTSQWLKNRIAGHRADIRSEEPKCMLGIHAKEEGHRIDWETIEILKKEKQLTKRCFLEMTEIQKESNTINRRTDIKDLSSIYFNLLK